MTIISIVTKNEKLVVDSRIIAEKLEIQHKNLMETIKTHQSVIEQAFGVITFETSKPTEGSQGGRPEKFAYLTEQQATLLMTFSRNTPAVIQCKVNLVTAFDQAKKQLEAIAPQPLKQHTAIEYIEATGKLENIKDSRLQRLLRAKLEHELSLNQVNQKLLTNSETENFTTLTVLAHNLGYSTAQIGDGVKLGKFIKRRISPAFQDYQGQYLVWHYKVTEGLKQAIHDFFSDF